MSEHSLTAEQKQAIARRARDGRGTLYSKTGRVEQARAALSAAVALYHDMTMTFWLPQAEAALAGMV